MQQWIEHAARIAALVAALLAAAAGAWRDIPLLPLALRVLVTGATVYAFATIPAQMARRAVLNSVAHDEMKRQEAPRSDTAPGEEAPVEREAA